MRSCRGSVRAPGIRAADLHRSTIPVTAGGCPPACLPAPGAPRDQSPPQSRYGVVVDSVNVSVLLYVPVRRASLAPIAWRNCTVTASLLIGPL